MRGGRVIVPVRQAGGDDENRGGSRQREGQDSA
jgi:hypothetical protein